MRVSAYAVSLARDALKYQKMGCEKLSAFLYSLSGAAALGLDFRTFIPQAEADLLEGGIHFAQKTNEVGHQLNRSVSASSKGSTAADS